MIIQIGLQDQLQDTAKDAAKDAVAPAMEEWLTCLLGMPIMSNKNWLGNEMKGMIVPVVVCSLFMAFVFWTTLHPKTGLGHRKPQNRIFLIKSSFWKSIVFLITQM